MVNRPELYVVDAFTGAAFGGNPAGVVILTEPAGVGWMQAVAAELRHSETAFVHQRADGTADLRWFTPVTEVDLCGHATLAAAHVLGGNQRFHTRSGLLSATVRPDGWVQLDFPADPPEPTEASADLIRALGGAEVRAFARGVSDVLVELATAAQVREIEPDLAALAQVNARGVIVTASDQAGPSDIVSRAFYPRVGVPEDPVTGSAHCTLASWWCPRLGRTSLLAEQASSRGGRLEIGLRGDRVRLTGQAVTVVEGHLAA